MGLLIVFIILSVFAFQFNTRPVSFAETPITTILSELSQNKDSNKTTTISGNEIEQLNLQKDLGEEIAALGVSDNVSLYYKNLNGNYEVKINTDRSWVPASMVKAFVVIEAFRQRRLRIIDFDSRVTIQENNVVPTEMETTGYQPLRAGVKATIRELVEAMIAQSDNTAYNTLLDVLDRRNIAISLRELGLTNTVVGEKLSLSDEQYAQDTLVPGRQPNRTTVTDFASLFTQLYEGKIPDSQEILTIFKKQEVNDMIPSLLPSNVEIAHKTGTWAPYYHDGGIVYKPGDPFVLVIFSDANNPSVVARLSKISYYKTRDVLGATITSTYGKILETLNQIKAVFAGVLRNATIPR